MKSNQKWISITHLNEVSIIINIVLMTTSWIFTTRLFTENVELKSVLAKMIVIWK